MQCLQHCEHQALYLRLTLGVSARSDEYRVAISLSASRSALLGGRPISGVNSEMSIVNPSRAFRDLAADSAKLPR